MMKTALYYLNFNENDVNIFALTKAHCLVFSGAKFLQINKSKAPLRHKGHFAGKISLIM